MRQNTVAACVYYGQRAPVMHYCTNKKSAKFDILQVHTLCCAVGRAMACVVRTCKEGMREVEAADPVHGGGAIGDPVRHHLDTVNHVLNAGGGGAGGVESRIRQGEPRSG